MPKNASVRVREHPWSLVWCSDITNTDQNWSCTINIKNCHFSPLVSSHLQENSQPRGRKLSRLDRCRNHRVRTNYRTSLCFEVFPSILLHALIQSTEICRMWCERLTTGWKEISLGVLLHNVFFETTDLALKQFFLYFEGFSAHGKPNEAYYSAVNHTASSGADPWAEATFWIHYIQQHCVLRWVQRAWTKCLCPINL